jgi:PAS domain S-box-containing protein
MEPVLPNATHFLKIVLDKLCDGVIVADPEGSFLVFNSAAERILGTGARDIHPEEWASVYGCYHTDKITPYPAHQLPLTRAIRGEEVLDEPIYIRNQDRPTGGWISVSGRPLKTGNGSTWGGLAIFRDITDQREAEDKLHLTLQLLSILIHSQKTAVLLESDKREIQFINTAFCELFGVFSKPSELMGKDCYQSVAQAKHLFPDPEGFVQRIEHLLREGRPVTNEKIYLRDGRVFERDYVPILSGGACLGHGWQYRDITERDEALKNLRLLERLSRALAQTADSVIITDMQGCIEYVNHAFETTTGYTAAEAMGNTPRILRSGMHDAAFYHDLWGRILSGQPFRGTVANRKRTGEIYWAEQTITPVRDDEGNITHFVSVLKDITELLKKKEQEVELHLARKVQQSFYRACAEIPGFDIAASTDPADETGGDYYDFICRPDGSLCIAVGDVSGHGISSALIMAETRAYVRSLAATMVDPGEILALVNKMLHEDLKDDRFVTLLLVCLDPRTRTLTFAGAGHEFGYLLNQSGEIAHVLKSSGPPLGPFADGLFSSDETLKLEKEQILLLLTDGVTESLNRCGRESLIGQVIKYVHKNRHEPSALIAAGLCAASRSFAEDRAVQDDATAIILKVL